MTDLATVTVSNAAPQIIPLTSAEPALVGELVVLPSCLATPAWLTRTPPP
jgi:hypothetical protein